MVWQGNYAQLFIGGHWVLPLSRETMEVVSPFTEQVVARVPSASRADVDRAVAAARQAFDHGPWPRLSLGERAEVLRRLSAAYRGRRDVLARLVTEEMGCPISLSVTMQATDPGVLVDTFVELASQYPFSSVRRSGSLKACCSRPEPAISKVPPHLPEQTPGRTMH